MFSEIKNAIQGLSDIQQTGRVIGTDIGALGDDERGWSGAEVRRISVKYESGSTGSMILKCAPLKERWAMDALTRAQTAVPVAFSCDLSTDEPRWMAMEDIGRPQPPSVNDAAWMGKAAGALADIHVKFMGKGSEMPWLPHADERYWKWIVSEISLDHFERKIRECPAFDREFGHYLPLLQRQADSFAADMTALYREGNCLTLTHGDIQCIDGAHIYDCAGTPKIIDFGWCHYAPFYVDLASYFSFDDAKLYHDALTRRGISLSYADFDERLRAAFRYSGFIYMCPSVMNWREDAPIETGRRLLQMIHSILHGDFPERRIAYSDPVFAKVLARHRALR